MRPIRLVLLALLLGALGFAGVAAAGLVVTPGDSFGAGTGDVQAGCVATVDTAAVTTKTVNPAGSFEVLGVDVSGLAPDCAGQQVTVTARDGAGDALGTAYGMASGASTARANFAAPIPDGNQITDYAIIVQDEAAQVYGGFLTGQAVVGSTLTAVVAAAGLPAQTVGYTWLRSTDGGSNWAPINGAGGSTYVLTAADLAAEIRVHASITNVDGTESVDTDPVGPVTGAAPVLTQIEVTGTPVVFQSPVTAQVAATGTPSPTVDYIWQRSIDGGVTWADIPGATNSTFTPRNEDYDTYLRLRATATNAVSSTTGYSGKTSLVGGFAPTVTSMTMTGSVYVGSAVRVNPNVQGGPIPQEVYQWQWSIDGAEWRDIDGATATTYSPVAGDVGHRLRMRILAINPLGMTTAYSTFTRAVSATQISSIGDLTLSLAPNWASVDPTGPWTSAVAGISAGLSDGTTSITTYNSSGTTDASVWWVNGTEDPAGSVTAVLYDADGNVVQAGGFSSQFNSYVGGSYWTHSITISNAAVGPGYELRVVNSSGHAIDAYQSVATRATLP